MVTKNELAKLYSNHNKVSIQEATQMITNLCHLLEDLISAGHSIRLPGIMTIGVKMTSPRKIRDPQTGEIRMTTAHPTIFMKPGSRLKEAARDVAVIKE